MSDIVQRLRDWAHSLHNAERGVTIRLLLEAANKIEQLQNMNEYLNRANIEGLSAYERVERHNIELDDEIKQLKGE